MRTTPYAALRVGEALQAAAYGKGDACILNRTTSTRDFPKRRKRPRGEEGSDWILARDGAKDTIACGTGKYDTVFFDQGGIDTVSDSCERKRGGAYSAASTSGATEEVSAKELEALRAR